jgi:hypothetical protein
MLRAVAVAPEQTWTGVPGGMGAVYQRSVASPDQFTCILTSREIQHAKVFSEKPTAPYHVRQRTVDESRPKLAKLVSITRTVNMGAARPSQLQANSQQ